MSCKSDLGTLISEIEWLVKNHSRCILESHERLNPCSKRITTSKNQSYTMKITLDIFVKLHQMLQNYIGLVNFHGPKSRDFGCLKIPLNEALDVTVRAMMSAMQSSTPKQPYSTPVCLNCTRTSECSRDLSVDLGNKCHFEKLPEIGEVDKKLLRLKVMSLENVENVEIYIKDILHAITKLPLTVMTSRLEILSSVVRNTKDKLTSCGRSSAASLMGTQVNPISQIISEFILEYGQIKSKIFPCRKICRFCNSVICPMDRQRNIFCCENARQLNFLWKEWTRQNSVKGFAQWDEDTIISIVDSSKDAPVEGKKCVPGGPCATFSSTAGQRGSRPGGQDGEGDNAKSRQGHPQERSEQRDKIWSDFSQGESQGVGNRFKNRGLQGKEVRRIEGREVRSKIDHSGSGEKQDTKNPSEKDHFQMRRDQGRGKGKQRETNSQNSERKNAGERGIGKTTDLDKTSRKKGSKKDAGEGDFNDQDYSPGVGGRKKSPRSGKGDPMKTEGDLNPENKRRGKSNRKTEGEFPDLYRHSGDPRIGNTGEPSGRKSSKKGKETRNSEKDDVGGQGTDNATSAERLRVSKKIEIRHENGTTEPDGLERGHFEKNDGSKSSGKKTREKYIEVEGEHGKRNTGKEQEVKSSNGTREDSENIIQYELSNELFIKLGWTLLPKDTVMRRVVEFQAVWSKPHMNWFKNNKIHGKQHYTDEKTIFMNFLEDGSGHVYYPNGQTAITAKISKKGTHELYKVYAPGGRDTMGVVRPPWLMAVFDSMGNGIVYNEDSSVRITYNQNGGVYVDNPAKVPFSWGWNNFQTFPIDEAVYEDPSAVQLPPELVPIREVVNSSSKASKQSKSSRTMSSGKLSEDQPLGENEQSKPIEPVKVIPRKVITPLKPICLKMNKYLSLRILDRKNINLQFFAGARCVRIELGTEVDPNVQINSELVDRDNWTEKMTKSRFYVDTKNTKLNSLSPDSSLLEIAKEVERAKNEANSRQSMIAKYRPHLISSSPHPSPT